MNQFWLVSWLSNCSNYDLGTPILPFLNFLWQNDRIFDFGQGSSWFDHNWILTNLMLIILSQWFLNVTNHTNIINSFYNSLSDSQSVVCQTIEEPLASN